MLGTLGSTVTINIGDTLTLAFSGRYYEAPGDNSGGFRFGFISPGDLDNNLYAQLGSGGNTGNGLYRDLGGDDSPGAGTTTGISSTASGTTYATLGTSAIAAQFSITRTGASAYTLSSNVNGAIRTATTTSGWNDYNAIFIRNGGISSDFLVDNVSVTLVPEPATALLGGLGLLGLLRRRR
ncbi:MAG: PEP-CTERM sorting domain-containing protein [Verrucomicrobia bacterium]|nr:PEP-CTERM sorting domain-containing protein [Verrucomicrobiota bacterium]